MNEVWVLGAAVAFGACLGLLYFGGLWATVRLLPGAHWAPLWMLLSLLLRLGILLAGMYWIGAGDWRRFVAALAGVILMRLLLTRQIGATRASEAVAAARAGGKP